MNSHKEMLILNMQNNMTKFAGMPDTDANRRHLEELARIYVKDLIDAGYVVERDYQIQLSLKESGVLQLGTIPQLEWLK